MTAINSTALLVARLSPLEVVESRSNRLQMIVRVEGGDDGNIAGITGVGVFARNPSITLFYPLAHYTYIYIYQTTLTV